MSQKTYPEIVNIVLDEADREYAFTLPQAVKEYILKTRLNNDLRLAYKEGDTKENFLKIPGKSSKTVTGLYLPESKEGRTIYFSCPAAGEILEIEFWR